MSQSETRRQKRTDHDQPVRHERHIEPVPADWAAYGRHEHELEGYTRFYAEKVAYEYTLERDPSAVGGVVEHHDLHVLYRNPETGAAVERYYQASVYETTANTINAPHSNPDGEGERPAGEWGTVSYAGVKPTPNALVVPKVVSEGEPGNFRASVAVHADEPRLGGEQ